MNISAPLPVDYEEALKVSRYEHKGNISAHSTSKKENCICNAQMLDVHFTRHWCETIEQDIYEMS